jgi:riboflavin synthase
MTERPSHSRNRETIRNVRVLINVFSIVVIDEVVAERLPKHRPRDRGQGDTNREFQNEMGAHSFVIVRRAAHANKLSILHVSGAKSKGVFTGLIEEVGRVLWIRMAERGTQLQVTAPKLAPAVAVGDSVAVNGCCLTVSAHRGEQVTFDLLEETLERTNLKQLRRDSPVNLERALAAGAPLGGHFVQGHIDCSAKVISFERTGEDYRLEVELPADFAHYAAYKGSVAVNGISLTIAELLEKSFAVWIIPHTKRQTNIDNIETGDWVNIEFDILAKYVERMLARYASRD